MGDNNRALVPFVIKPFPMRYVIYVENELLGLFGAVPIASIFKNYYVSDLCHI